MKTTFDIIPINVEAYWCDTMNLLSNTFAELDEFSKYIVDNYFEGNFPMKYWNHFLTVGNRTNNHVEGYNLKLRKWIGAKAPKAINLLAK